METNIPDIKSWKKFSYHIRRDGAQLLKEIKKFHYPIFVTGCQRSGTTMLSRIINQSNGMANYWFGEDDELAAALILSGHVHHTPLPGRYCFQTTYLNECYEEYLSTNVDFSLVWLLRNPYSVVYSLMYNWKTFALNELYRSCGAKYRVKSSMSSLKDIFVGINLQRACFSYIGKTNQILYLSERLPKHKVYIIDYDYLVKYRKRSLPLLFKYCNLEYKVFYSEKILKKNLYKFKLMGKKKLAFIDKFCTPIYKKALSLVTH